MDFDDLKLRQAKHLGDGPGKTFKASTGSFYVVTVSAIEGAPHVVRAAISRIGKTGNRLADLGTTDVHFAPEQDLEALIIKNVKLRILEAPRQDDGAVAEYLAKEWGVEA